MRSIILVLLFIFIGQQQLFAQKATKIWVVRHAEKDTSNTKDRDPDLSPEGKERAEDLMRYLKSEKLDSIFSTNYKRTRLTGFRLADHIGISIKNYDAANQDAWAKELLVNAQGKKMLIIGHSNTVQELLVALGAEKKPVKDLTEADYDYIFLLTIKGNKVDVKVDRFGKSNHSGD